MTVCQSPPTDECNVCLLTCDSDLLSYFHSLLSVTILNKNSRSSSEITIRFDNNINGDVATAAAESVEKKFRSLAAPRQQCCHLNLTYNEIYCEAEFLVITLWIAHCGPRYSRRWNTSPIKQSQIDVIVKACMTLLWWKKLKLAKNFRQLAKNNLHGW